MLKGNESFYIALSFLRFLQAQSVHVGQEREEVLFILPSRPTRIFNLAFLLQHLLRIIHVWHLADLSYLVRYYNFVVHGKDFYIVI